MGRSDTSSLVTPKKIAHLIANHVIQPNQYTDNKNP